MDYSAGNLDNLNEEEICEILKYIKNKEKCYLVCKKLYQLCSSADKHKFCVTIDDEKVLNYKRWLWKVYI